MPHTPSSRNSPDCASFRTDVARRARASRSTTPPAPLPRSPARARLAAVRRSPRPSSSASSPLPAARPVDRPRLSLPAAPLPLDARRPPVPESPTRPVPHSPVPPPTCCVPRSPPAPLNALGPTHIWVGRGRGSPVRSSGDPLPRCQVPRAIWRGAKDTAPDSHPRLAREVGGRVGDESRGRESEAGVNRNRLGRREERGSSAALDAPPSTARPRVATARTIPSGACVPSPREPEPAEEAHPPARSAPLPVRPFVTAEAAQTRCTVYNCHTRR